MANEEPDMRQAEGWIMDRFTGRENGTAEPDPKMTIVDRVERAVAAEYELGRAEIALEQGVNKIEISGSYEDMQTAIEILKASVEYHCGQIDEQELVQAVHDQDVRADEAELILDRRADMREASGIEMDASYYDNLESRIEQSDEVPLESGQSKSGDEGQTR